MGKVLTKVPKFIDLYLKNSYHNKVSFGFLSCTATLPFLGILNHMRSTKLDPTLPKQAVSHIFQEKSHCTELKSFGKIWVQRNSYLSKKPKMFCTFENLKVKRWKNPKCWILKIQNVLNLWISNELFFFCRLFFLVGIFVPFFNWMFALRRRRTTIACTYVNIICRYVYVICKFLYKVIYRSTNMLMYLDYILSLHLNTSKATSKVSNSDMKLPKRW